MAEVIKRVFFPSMDEPDSNSLHTLYAAVRMKRLFFSYKYDAVLFAQTFLMRVPLG